MRPAKLEYVEPPLLPDFTRIVGSLLIVYLLCVFLISLVSASGPPFDELLQLLPIDYFL